MFRQSTDTGVLIEAVDENVYATQASGTVVVTDLNAASTYAPGCIYRDSSGQTWKNTGTLAVPAWSPLQVTGEKYLLETFKKYPIKNLKTGITAPTGTAGDENIMLIGENMFEWHVLGTQTIVSPLWDGTAGLDFNSMDQTDNDGAEYSNGITAAARPAFVIGTDRAFFFEVTFSIADVSGTDDCAIGFRKAEDYQANVDDYADMAALNVISGDIKIETIVGGAATTTTDTTDNWADAASHTLRVNVSSAGVVTYLIDGVAPTTTAAFTFTSALTVIPFFFFLNSSDVAGAIRVTKWEVGYQ